MSQHNFQLQHRPTILEGNVWVLRDQHDCIIDDIDTDMIFHNAHLAVTDIRLMGQYALGNLAGYENFPRRVQPGDIIVAGKNFGAGSSRQQAVDCFVSLGVSVLIAESFGAIYKRNAINAGFPIMEAAGLSELLRDHDQKWWAATGEQLRVDLTSGTVQNLSSGLTHQARPMSQVQIDIYQAGDLFAYRPAF